MDVRWWWWWHLPILLITAMASPPETESDKAPRSSADMAALCKSFSEGNELLQEFYSPNYPLEYPDEMDCYKVVTAPEGHVVKVIFMDMFHVELSEGCQFDFLEIKDGKSGSAVELSPKLCGHEFPDYLQSTDRYIWFHFRSDPEVGYTGFKVRYEFISIESTKMPAAEGCKYSVDGYAGNISKSDINHSVIEFAQTSNAPLDCIWNISVPAGWNVRIQFYKFELGKPNDCQSNFMHLYEQQDDVTDHVFKFCGTMADSRISQSSMMQMRFFATKEALKESEFTAMFTAFRNKRDDTEVCKDDEFDCEDRTCISRSLVCDGPKNCQHEWDENDCSHKVVKNDFDLAKTSNLVILILTLGMGLGMLLAFGFQCVKKLRQDHEEVQEEVRRSRELLEEGSVRVAGVASVPAPVPSQETLRSAGGGSSVPKGGSSVAKYTNGEVVLANSYSAGNAVDQEVTVYGDYDEEEEDEERCVEMRDNACQTRDSLWDTNWDGGMSKEGAPQKTPSSSSSFAIPQQKTPSSSSPAIPPRIPTGRRMSERPPMPASAQQAHRPSLPVTSAATATTEPRTFHAEAKIEMAPGQQRPCSLDSSKSAPDVVVTH